MPEPISAGAALLIGSGISAGAGMLSSYMAGSAQEEMAAKELAFKKQQFRHQKNMDQSANSRAEDQHASSQAQAESSFNRQLRNDAQDQALYISALRSMNSGV